jgi:Protein of unknown function (DUF2380)
MPLLSFARPCRKCVSPRANTWSISAPGRHRKVRGWMGLALLLTGAMAFAEPAGLRTIAILDFELIDDQQALAPATVEYERLKTISNQLREEFAKNHFYAVVDNTPAAALIKRFQSTQTLRSCNGCELEIARALSADRVLVAWVQKVSNLILNINIQIEDAASGAVLLNKSVDLRGNTDETWRRGISYMVRDMVEKQQGNR